MLATTCPGCGTVFRVQTEQLRQRNGLVRCGVCHQVFNALEALQPVAEHDTELEPGLPATAGDAPVIAPAGSPTTAATTAPPNSPDPSAAIQASVRASGRADPDAAPRSASVTLPEAAPVGPPVTPVAAPTGPPAASAPVATPAAPIVPPVAFPDDDPAPRLEISSEAHSRSPGPQQNAAGVRAPLPVRPSVHVDVHAETSRAAAAARLGNRSARSRRTNLLTRSWPIRRAAPRTAAALVVLLAIAALVQTLLLARNSLAMWMPASRPALASLAGVFGLTVEVPRRLSQLALERFELRPDSGASRLTLSAVLRNRGDTAAQWPAIELTLADSSGTAVVRRVLLPSEYLAGTPTHASSGIAPRAELPLQLVLEAPAAQWTRPTATLFYP